MKRNHVAAAALLALVVGLVRPGRLGAQSPSVPVGEIMTSAVTDGVKGAVKNAVGSLPRSLSPVKAAAPGPSQGTAGHPVVPAAAAVMPTDPAERLAFLRKKILRDDDFVDNDEINRDPFRSYLRLFGEKPITQVHKVPAIFEKFALEELALIAVVSGDANPRAMFRDPAGFGMTVKRGDYVSKSAARITKILSDQVVFELTEIQPNGESKTTEKAVLVNPGARR
jgi:hypothetical protein